MDYKELEQELKLMTRRSKLYRLVKAEMTRRGNWRNAARGKPFKSK